MKTKEELNELKTEFEAFTTKLKELTEEELTQVTGGGPIISIRLGDPIEIGRWYGERNMANNGGGTSGCYYYYCKNKISDNLYTFVKVINIVSSSTDH